ncbi:MAG: hypothetical protein JKY37_19750 [Nannocystaceae bacterium]|nr:hypothetical protein [Nannocystaceae bacterium]
MSMPIFASALALLAAMTATVGCDSDTEIPDELVLDREDHDDETDADGEPRAESQVLAACEYLGADRTCGAESSSVQFCAWLFNEDTHEVSTYWGECVAEPECSLWSCRESDDALCDLVDGKPQWIPESCDW